MKYRTYIFWSLLIAIALLRWWSVEKIKSPEIGCLKQVVISQGIIISEPEIKDSGQVFVIKADDIRIKDKQEACVENLSVKVKTKLYPRFNYGDEVTFTGKILKPFNFKSSNERSFDYSGFLAKDDIYYEMKSAQVIEQIGLNTNDSSLIGATLSKIYKVKRSYISALKRNLGEPESALAAGLTVGEKSALGKDLIDDFRKAGLIHIVVLSGYNITIVADSIRKLLKFLPRVYGIILGGLGIALFGILVGGGATVIRSCFMAGIALFADLIRRDYSVIRALALAGLIMLIQNPLILLHDPSFQLSFLATVGLIALAKPIENRLFFITEKYGLRSIIASTLATQIFVAPFILYTMGQVSVIGMLSNILVLPFIPLTMLFVFLTGFSGIFILAIAKPFAWISHFFLSYIILIVQKSASLPFSTVNVPTFSFTYVVIFYAVLGGVLVLFRSFRDVAHPEK